MNTYEVRKQDVIPKTYKGSIILHSCKAGDTSWTAYSLVNDVSQNLFGYESTVFGLKGNVVVRDGKSSRPGVARSIMDAKAHDAYKKLAKSYTSLVSQQEDEFNKGPGGKAALRVKINRLQKAAKELELRALLLLRLVKLIPLRRLRIGLSLMC